MRHYEVNSKIFIFLLFFISLSSPQNTYAGDLPNQKYFDGFSTIEFSEDEILYTPFCDCPIEEAITYSLKYELKSHYGVDFINLIGGTFEGIDTFLVIRNENLIILYTGDESRVWFIGLSDISTRHFESLGTSINVFQSSSFLVESQREYSPENLTNIQLFFPWVEGIAGFGINETIILTDPRPNVLLISNGFVSFDRPELFEMNSRVRSIQIEDSDTGGSKTVVLEDSPNIQAIDISEHNSGDYVIIRIVDVYEGSKWDDTCINFIVPFYNQNLFESFK